VCAPADLVPYAAAAGDELQTVVVAPHALSDSIFVCPADCTGASACLRAAVGCRAPRTRRFDYLFGELSPSSTYFSQYVPMTWAQGARNVVLVYEHQDKILTEMMHGAREEALNWGFRVVAEIGVAVGGDQPAPRDVLLGHLHRSESGAHHTIQEKLEYAGSWQDVLVPVVALVNELDVDVVVSGSSYDGCLGLVQAFIASGRLPKALALGLASGVQLGMDSDLYANLDKNVRWLSGVHICRV
jgi:hypothetical protein